MSDDTNTTYFICGKRKPGKAETVRQIIMTDLNIIRDPFSISPLLTVDPFSISPLITDEDGDRARDFYLPPPPNYRSYAQPEKKPTDEETLKHVQQAVYIIWLKNFSIEHPSFLKWYDENFIKLDN